MTWESRFIEVYQEAVASDQDSLNAVDLANLTGQDPQIIGRDIYRLKQKYGEDLPVEIERDSPVDPSEYHFNGAMGLDELKDVLESDGPVDKKERLLDDVVEELNSREYSEAELNTIISSLAQKYYDRIIHRAEASREVKEKLEEEEVLDKNGETFQVEAD